MRLRAGDSSPMREEHQENDFLAQSTPILSQIGDLSKEPPFCDISYNFSEFSRKYSGEEANVKLERRAPLGTTKKLRRPSLFPEDLEKQRVNHPTLDENYTVVEPQEKPRRLQVERIQPNREGSLARGLFSSFVRPGSEGESSKSSG